jgi:cytochrome b561
MHWLMFFLMIAVYSCIELREMYPKGSDPREAFKMWHFMLGLTTLCLVCVRVGVRLVQVTPAIVPALDNWQHLFAKTMQLLLYAVMIGMPIAGWLILSAAGKPVPFWGLELPPLMAENKDMAELIEDAHKLAGKISYFLIAGHTLAALFHHYFQKDNTLTRMLPGGKS